MYCFLIKFKGIHYDNPGRKKLFLLDSYALIYIEHTLHLLKIQE